MLIWLSLALWAQEQRPTFRVKVDMVVLSFTVTDSKGHYINGLKPSDFRLTEDSYRAKDQYVRRRQQATRAGAGQRNHSSADGIRGGRGHRSGWREPTEVRSDSFVGTNVFVLFDTSNYMYRGFVYASDAIADFVRGLDKSDSVAVYTFSRNLSRPAPAHARPQRRHFRPSQSRGGRRRGAL